MTSTAAAPPRPAERTRPWACALALGVPLALLLALAARLDFLCDDAFISFRYARNLVEGRGLTFNAFVEPPVEGYSNLLWTLSMAVALRLGGSPLVASRALSVLAAALLLLAVARVGRRRLGLGPLAAGGMLAFLATSPGLGVWATSGLETLPFVLAVFLVFERLAGEEGRARWLGAGLAAGAAALLRSDGFLFAGAALGVVLATAGLRREGRLARAALQAAALLAVVVALNFLWRHATYGEWLPNTARIKAGLSATRVERGLLYLASNVLTVPALLLVPLAGLALARPAARILALQAAALALFPALYATSTGGDFLPFGRFLLPGLPFVALLLGAALGRLEGSPARVTAAAALAVGLSLPAAFDRHLVPEAWREACHFRWTSSDYKSEHRIWREEKENTLRWLRDGRALARFTREEESIVLAAIGAVGYGSRLQVHDLYGLVSPEVASLPAVRATPGHDRVADHAFFLPQAPTYLGYSVGRLGGELRSGPSGAAAFVDVERHPLDEGIGGNGGGEAGEQGLELRLFRLNEAGRAFANQHRPPRPVSPGG